MTANLANKWQKTTNDNYFSQSSRSSSGKYYNGLVAKMTITTNAVSRGSSKGTRDDRPEKVRKTQGKFRVVSTRSLPGDGARPVERKTAGWKGRMTECCAFLDTGMAALRLSWYSVGVVTSCWYSVVDVTRSPLPTRTNPKRQAFSFQRMLKIM